MPFNNSDFVAYDCNVDSTHIDYLIDWNDFFKPPPTPHSNYPFHRGKSSKSTDLRPQIKIVNI